MNMYRQSPLGDLDAWRLGWIVLMGILMPGAMGSGSSPAMAQSTPPEEITPSSLVPVPPELTSPAVRPTDPTPHTPATPVPIFVDVQAGHDRQGTGSQVAPYRTLTHALQVAPSGTVILLAPGVYDQAQGEAFPLQLQPDVTIQGNPTAPETVILQGGGPLPVGGETLNVTLLGADRAALVGVTVTNPNPQGHAIWIGDRSPTIVESVLTGNEGAGITIAGQSRPLLQRNQFRQNGIGVQIVGMAQPRLRGNTLQENNIGMLVADQARPQLAQNQFQQNRDGLVAIGEAQPIVRQNQFTAQTRDGVVVTDQALPDLGTEREAGNNQFQNNRRFDINAQATTAFIPAVGSAFDRDRSLGRIDQSGRITRRIPLLAAQDAVLSAGGAASPVAIPVPRPDSGPAASTPIAAIPVPPPTAALPQPFPQPLLLATATPASSPLGTAAHFPTPNLAAPVESGRLSTRYAAPVIATSRGAAPAPSPQRPAVSPVTVAVVPTLVTPPSQPPVPVAVPVSLGPSVPSAAPVAIAQVPVAQAGRSTPAIGPSPILAVPSAEIPVGATEGNQRVWQPGQSLPRQSAPPPQAPISSPPPQAAPNTPGMPYRVVVQVVGPQDQARLQSVLPNTLQTPIPGRPLMQVGTFGDRSQAAQLQKALQRQGLQVFVEQW